MQSVESIIETTMTQLRSIVDVNTIVGEPVLSQKDILVVPVSKVSFGFFSGGGEYPPMGKVLKSAESVQKEGYPFLGTAVAGVSITPKAFLAASGGRVQVLPAEYEGTFDRLVELMPQMVRDISRAAGACRREDAPQKPDVEEAGRENAAPPGKAETEPPYEKKACPGPVPGMPVHGVSVAGSGSPGRIPVHRSPGRSADRGVQRPDPV